MTGWIGRRRAQARTRQAAATVLGTWSEVLGAAVAPDDDFLGIGGTSLHAVQIVGRLEDELQVHLSVRLLFESRTPRVMAERITELLTTPADGAAGDGGTPGEPPTDVRQGGRA